VKAPPGWEHDTAYKLMNTLDLSKLDVLNKRTQEIQDVFRLRQKERKKKEEHKAGEKVKVDLIDGKRQTNLAIALNQFKTGGRPMQPAEIVAAIKDTDTSFFGPQGIDFIERLVSMAPNETEIETLSQDLPVSAAATDDTAGCVSL